MRRFAILFLIASLLGLGGCRLPQALRVATAFSAHQICAQAFVSRQPVAPLVHAYVRPMIGVPVVREALDWRLDPMAQTVHTSLVGMAPTLAAYTEGRGCTVRHGTVPLAPLTHPPIASTPLPVALDPDVSKAVDLAFTLDRRAILVLRDGVIVAERYAPGYGPEIRLQSWSMAKSLTNALIGILVRQGRLRLDQQVAGLPSGVTIDGLLRQTAGQGFGAANSGFDKASRMQFLESDTAAFAATGFTAQPGTRWSYSDANYALLSRVIREAAGGSAQAVADLADRELFSTTGMASASFDYDEAGNPMGANWAYATARDWARFGLLYASGGMAGGHRVLPEDWVDYSCTPTPLARLGYGAGFWANRGPSSGASQRRAWGLAADSCFALGNSGQIVLVAPASGLVIVSLGYGLDASNRTTVKAVAKLFVAADKRIASGRY